jgi:hypothetical protein
MSMYPDNQVLEIFGEQVEYPGLGPDGKFTNGSFINPEIKPSLIPAESINLLLDNLQAVIESAGLNPNNTGQDQVLRALRKKYSPRIVGEYRFLSYQPSVDELVEKRILPLQYQIIDISLYQELCDLKWVGPEGNDTADWWYKCDQDGARNENGLYMRVEDMRGLFIRGAGANAVKTGANDTPYNGNAIGTYIPDAIRNITGSCYPMIDNNSGGSVPVRDAQGAIFTPAEYQISYLARGAVVTRPCGIGLDVSRVVPTSTENCPASISSCLVITY